jgi:omega-hydroxypalmitate O-feruloyl transferase
MQVVEMKENGVAAAAGAGEKAAPQLSVKRGEPTLVPPAEPTPTGEQYYLSNLDQNIAVIVQTVYCYKPSGGAAGDGGKDDVAAALRDALARVLVHYHPLAGRLGISPEMKLTVELTGEGAVFVEADACCDLADVGDLTKPDPAALGQLVYSVPGAKHILEMPPMTAQVRPPLTAFSFLARFRLGARRPRRPATFDEPVALMVGVRLGGMEWKGDPVHVSTRVTFFTGAA